MPVQGGAFVTETTTNLSVGSSWGTLTDTTPRVRADDNTTDVLSDDGKSPVFWAGPDQMTSPQTLSQLNVARNSKAAGLTATGTTRANALALTADIIVLTTVALSTGVVLSGTKDQTIFNDGANPVQVYAPDGITIDGVAGATGVPLTNTKRCHYYLTGALTYESAQLGVVSA